MMKTATTIDQSYTGPTINPNGEALARLTHQFAKVRGPQQLKRALIAWGLSDDISPRQARFWNDSTEGERRAFCRIANTPFDYISRQWAQIPAPHRADLWKAIGAAAQWSERLRGRW